MYAHSRCQPCCWLDQPLRGEDRGQSPCSSRSQAGSKRVLGQHRACTTHCVWMDQQRSAQAPSEHHPQDTLTGSSCLFPSALRTQQTAQESWLRPPCSVHLSIEGPARKLGVGAAHPEENGQDGHRGRHGCCTSASLQSTGARGWASLPPSPLAAFPAPGELKGCHILTHQDTNPADL